jgi:hypothetical protein
MVLCKLLLCCSGFMCSISDLLTCFFVCFSHLLHFKIKHVVIPGPLLLNVLLLGFCREAACDFA